MNVRVCSEAPAVYLLQARSGNVIPVRKAAHGKDGARHTSTRPRSTQGNTLHDSLSWSKGGVLASLTGIDHNAGTRRLGGNQFGDKTSSTFRVLTGFCASEH